MDEAWPIGLAVALPLLSFPLIETASRDRVSAPDWLVVLIGAFCASYFFWFYRELSDRPGLPTTTDLTVASVGPIMLLEATRRALGPPLMIVAMLFLFYVFSMCFSATT